MARKNRKEELIAYLLQQKDYQTAQEIAEALDVSSKTIYRTVDDINKDAAEAFIMVERGRGLKLNYKIYMASIGSNADYVSDYTPIERRNKILQELLLAAPGKRKVRDVFEPFFVSESVIWSDEKRIEEFLQDYNLTLNIEKGYIYISGTEKKIRKALSELINTSQTMDLMEYVTMDHFNNSYDVRFVLRQIEYIEKSLGADVPYPYNVNLFSHLYILLNRIRTAGKREEGNRQENTIQPDMEREICRTVIKNIEGYLVKSVPVDEEQNLYQYLQSSRLSNQVNKSNANISKDEGLAIYMMLKYFTIYLQEHDAHMKVNLSSQLRERLAIHVRPMLNRLRNDINLKNTVLGQIQQEYRLFYEATKYATDCMVKEKILPPITDDEVGFLTLYFAQAAEATYRRLRVLLMCTTGIGTAALLEMKIKRYFSDVDIVETIASTKLDYALEKHPNVDLIISTVNLKQKHNIPMITVSAMMNANDQQLISSTLKELTYV